MKILLENWRQKMSEMEERPLETPEDHEYRKRVHEVKDFIDHRGFDLEERERLLEDLRKMFEIESTPL
tara:strand:+ start:336 stop:539 length:204 start_codon:yes stop_codon:yes gene_type:complete